MPQFKRVRLINPPRARARNVMGFVDSNHKFHPIRASDDYSPKRAGEARKSSKIRTRRSRSKSREKNPVLRSRARAPIRKTNPLGEELILLSNPRRKRNSRRRRTNPVSRLRRRSIPVAAAPRRRRSNPFRSSRRRMRRRNPETGGAKMFAIGGVKAIVAGGVGAVATRAVVQGVLGDKNVGMLGYASNLAVALGGGYALLKFTKSYPIAIGWAVGGFANTLQRIWSEKVAMTSPAAAAPQLGDLDYSSNGLGGVGLSGYVNTGYALPSSTAADGTVSPPFSTPQLPATAGSNAGAAVPSTVTRFAPRY